MEVGNVGGIIDPGAPLHKVLPIVMVDLEGDCQ